MILESCEPTAQLYRHDDERKNYKGQLSELDYTALQQFLTAKKNAPLKDTIIIKFEYNNETCWDALDQKGDSYIMGFVTRHKERVEDLLDKRKNVSVFDFREPGNNLNKIVKWDDSIIIDSTKQLFHLLFKERCTCGSSIMVMPDRRFVFKRSDSHSEMYEMTKDEINTILHKK